jgi:hypothetical protein
MDISRIIKQHKATLLTLQEVVGIAPATKVTGGRDTGRPCITVFVRRKLAEIELARDQVIPKTLAAGGEAVETDVVEVGEVRILPLLATTEEVENQLKQRPVLGGVSISPGNFLLAGTGGLIVEQNGVSCILSNNHVLRISQITDPDKRPQKGLYIRQPGFLDDGRIEDSIGELWDWVEVNFPGPNQMDCAIGKLTVPYATRILGLGSPAGLGEPGVGLRVNKSGRTSGLTRGTITYLDVTMSVDHGGGVTAVFEGQVMTTPMLEAGDSGSAIVDQDNQVIALGFAGSSQCSLATPIRRVFEKLRLTLPEPTGEVPVEQALAQLGEECILWGFDARNQQWVVYDPKAYPYTGDLKYLVPGCGYWLRVNKAQILRYNGFQWPLYEGWNLIGWR